MLSYSLRNRKRSFPKDGQTLLKQEYLEFILAQRFNVFFSLRQVRTMLQPYRNQSIGLDYKFLFQSVFL